MPRIFGRLALFGALITLPACSTDGLLDPSNRPTTPPADALNADFSFFHDRTPEAGGTTVNWELALERITAADTLLSDALAVPFAALHAASTVTGTRTGDNWSWPFSIEVDGEAFDGELRSGIAGGQYTFDLYIDAPDHDPVLSNYLWATGLVAATAFDGRWWIADAENGTADVAAVVSWIVNQTNDVEFAYSEDAAVVWVYQRTDETTVVTKVVNGAAEYRVTWLSDAGTGSTWTAETNITACWNAQLHDVAC